MVYSTAFLWLSLPPDKVWVYVTRYIFSVQISQNNLNYAHSGINPADFNRTDLGPFPSLYIYVHTLQKWSEIVAITY